jgi:hypothetical protein
VEFRIFGNCHDPDDIEENVRLAGLAFLRGYRRFYDGNYTIENAAECRRHVWMALTDEDYQVPRSYYCSGLVHASTEEEET